MKKYYFSDGYVHKCENLSGSGIANLETFHGSLTEVMLSGLGCVKCEEGILPVHELNSTKFVMDRRAKNDGERTGIKKAADADQAH